MMAITWPNPRVTLRDGAELVLSAEHGSAQPDARKRARLGDIRGNRPPHIASGTTQSAVPDAYAGCCALG
jgi:hypothetical protein